MVNAEPNLSAGREMGKSAGREHSEVGIRQVGKAANGEWRIANGFSGGQCSRTAEKIGTSEG